MAKTSFGGLTLTQSPACKSRTSAPLTPVSVLTFPHEASFPSLVDENILLAKPSGPRIVACQRYLFNLYQCLGNGNATPGGQGSLRQVSIVVLAFLVNLTQKWLRPLALGGMSFCRRSDPYFICRRESSVVSLAQAWTVRSQIAQFHQSIPYLLFVSIFKLAGYFWNCAMFFDRRLYA